MSKRVRIKLNRAAVRALMKSPEMREILAEQAQAIAGRCGDGYETRVGTAETRAIATVYLPTLRPAAITTKTTHWRGRCDDRANRQGFFNRPPWCAHQD